MCFSITFVLIAIIATILFIFFERFCCLSPDGESGLKLEKLKKAGNKYLKDKGKGFKEVVVKKRSLIEVKVPDIKTSKVLT